MQTSETLYWGLKLYELFTLLAIVLGPVLAVGITVATETRRNLKSQQVQTLRTLISTRHLPSDPAYSTTINLIPIDFNGVGKVITAWNAYIEKIRIVPAQGGEETHDKEIVNKQTKLIFSMVQHLGYGLSESDIDISAYAAKGFIDRDNLYLEALGAWPRIATALETQSQWIAAQPKNEEI